MNWDVKEEDKLPIAQEEEPWQLYVARFQSIATINDRPEIPVHVEIQVTGRRTAEETLSIAEIRRFSLYSAPLDELGGPLSVIGPAEKQQLARGTAGEMQAFHARIFYHNLSKYERGCQENDAIYPQMETLVGVLSWWPERVREDGILRVFFAADLHELVVAVAGDVRSIFFESKEAAPFYLPDQLPPPEALGQSLSACSGAAPGGTAHSLRALNVRFHSVSAVRSTAALKTPVQDWINAACRVWWQKGGIKIVPSPQIDQHTYPAATPGIITNETDETGIGAALGDVDTNRIDIYLADTLTEGHGGGLTRLCGTSDAYILLEIGKAENNKYLLAHELGHVLGLRHPGDAAPPEGALCQSYVEGSPCSVMLPSKPMSSRNTETNIAVSINSSFPLVAPVFDVLPGATDWAPNAAEDIFHFVRDFPYDDGSEASVPESPFVDWWTHSDVWNASQEPESRLGVFKYQPARYVDGTAIFALDHSPIHAEPACGGPNWMYVHLHTCQALTGAADPQIKTYLYLAVPGASSEPLTRLVAGANPDMSFSNTSLPTPSFPRTRWVQWSVPAGYPPHCCVFSVSVSDYQPASALDATIEDITENNNFANYNFYHLHQRLMSKNDIAQRNLHIAGCTPPAGSSLSAVCPWVQMGNPCEQAAAAHVEIDSSQARDLIALSLEVDGKPGPGIEIGGTVRVPLAESLSPGEGQILRLRATIPPDRPLGTAFPVNLRFFVGETVIGGYQHVLRVAPLAESVAQAMDALYGALRDVQAAHRLDIQDLVEQVRLLIPAAAGDPEGTLADLRARAASFAALARDIEKMAIPKQVQDVYQPLAQLVALLSASEVAQAPDAESAPADEGPDSLLASLRSPGLFAAKIRELADRIQEPAGRRVRQKA